MLCDTHPGSHFLLFSTTSQKRSQPPLFCSCRLRLAYINRVFYPFFAFTSFFCCSFWRFKAFLFLSSIVLSLILFSAVRTGKFLIFGNSGKFSAFFIALLAIFLHSSWPVAVKATYPPTRPSKNGKKLLLLPIVLPPYVVAPVICGAVNDVGHKLQDSTTADGTAVFNRILYMRRVRS